MCVKPRGMSDIQLNVYCGNDPLQTVSSAKYLGITVDDDLSWKTHLGNLAV